MIRSKLNSPILLIGAGKMGSALIAGWLKHGLGPVIAVEPKPSPALKKLKGLKLVAALEDLPAQRFRACVVAIKPQVLKGEAARLKAIAAAGTTMISIAAGTRVAFLARAWGKNARILRAMPNTPSAIGRGITALYAARGATAADRKLAQSLLAALGDVVWIEREALIDAVTAVSGCGPAYVFALVEALAEAGVKQGLELPVAEKLARATVCGAGALLDVDSRPPADLRRDVASPGGATEAGLNVLLGKGSLHALMAKTVAAARKRARELSR
jgi:pyrroline-5-carboxylate reductase